jgi:hypothetical protein
MKRKEFKNHKKITNLLFDLAKNQIDIFNEIYEKHINKQENTNSKMFRMSETLVCIIKNNDANHENLFLKYFSISSSKIKLEIKYGKNKVVEYVEKLRKRDRPKVSHSIFDYKYWMNLGFTEEESKNKVKNIQINNVKRRTEESYKKFSKKIKYSVDYWLNLGYNLDEAKILRQPYLSKVKNDLNSFVERYGIEEGTEKWIRRCSKYKQSIKENLSNRRTAGYVSKESLKFFIPLYKFCRRLGLERKDIYFGIKGSKEFFIRDDELHENGGKFYDFCIPKLNLIVEYHGTFWHPKNINEWNNPWTNFEDALTVDNHKKLLAEKRNMEYHVVWSNDNLKEKCTSIFNLIQRKFHEL